MSAYGTFHKRGVPNAPFVALSLRQPWAWCVLHLGKVIENRKWCTDYRGPLLIHASATMKLDEDYEACAQACDDVFGVGHYLPNAQDIARGGFVGRARLTGVVGKRPSRLPISGNFLDHYPPGATRAPPRRIAAGAPPSLGRSVALALSGAIRVHPRRHRAHALRPLEGRARPLPRAVRSVGDRAGDTTMNVIELFSCSGGMAEGLRRAGIHVTTAIDFDENACASYEKNLGERPIRMDVRDLLRLAWAPTARIDLFVADPPCTPWSRAGKRKGLEDQHDMLLETVALVRHIKPRAFLIANVPGLDDGPNWPIVQRTIGSLSKLGYCIDFARLDAADYGVPQHRFRPFWYGHLHAELPCVQWPARTHGSPQECRNTTIAGVVPILPWVTCRQALGHLPLKELGRPIRLRWRGANGKKIASTPDDPARVVGTSTLSDGNILTTPEEAMRKSHKPSKKPRASHADEPAGTVTTTNNGNGGILFDGPDHRPTSMDEPAKTIPRNTHSDGALLLLPWVEHGKRRRKDVRPVNDTGMREPDTLAVVPHHPPSNEDEPSRVVRATNATTPDKVLLLRERHDGTIRESHADAPAHTIRGGRSSSERMLVTSSKHPPNAPDAPANTVAGCDKQRAHVLNGNAKHAPSAPDEPAHTIAAKDRGAQHWPWDRPSTTIQRDERIPPPGHHDKYSTRSMPNAIKLSEKAAAILQGFPESWVFVGKTKRARWQQLGMAMPPGLAEAVGRSIARALQLRRWSANG
jgi:DNA-cytosine methyltransferase